MKLTEGLAELNHENKDSTARKGEKLACREEPSQKQRNLIPNLFYPEVQRI